MTRGTMLMRGVIGNFKKFFTAVHVDLETKQAAFDFCGFLQIGEMRRTFSNHELTVALRQEIDVFILADTAHQGYRIGLALVEMTGLFNTKTGYLRLER